MKTFLVTIYHIATGQRRSFVRDGYTAKSIKHSVKRLHPGWSVDVSRVEAS